MLNHLKRFAQILPPSSILTDINAIQPYITDYQKHLKPLGSLVLKPNNTSHLSQILSYCNTHKIPIVPQGGNTGLVYGSVPLRDEIVISLSSMNKIESFDASSSIVTAESGVILQTLEQYLAQYSQTIPLDLASKGSCQLGGVISTNAGGIRLLRYGSLHNNVIGLEVVTAKGEVLNLMSQMRKDNTGYSLKNLFIGAEGTLGIISKVSMLTVPKYRSKQVILLAVTRFEDIQTILELSRAKLGEILSAFEFFDSTCLKLLLKSGFTNPFSTVAPYYLLIETLGSNVEHDYQKLTEMFESLTEKNLITDGTLAQNETQVTSLWRYREEISSLLSNFGHVYKYDISVPLNDFQKLPNMLKTAFPFAQVISFGHIGDSNLHLNLITPTFNVADKEQFDKFVYDYVINVQGSISAEHGLGSLKNRYLPQIKSEEVINYYQQLKRMFDPNGILNPGKMLPY